MPFIHDVCTYPTFHSIGNNPMTRKILLSLGYHKHRKVDYQHSVVRLTNPLFRGIYRVYQPLYHHGILFTFTHPPCVYVCNTPIRIGWLDILPRD